ncbi:MAG: filamentous hemagglutinin N-terminal domain-containing protein, partial [Verrucomicrobiales bacterium]|nr:filamentous hemagglutinin N-terminal domain-containing protein [Verrucomicrobiales bacterium]
MQRLVLSLLLPAFAALPPNLQANPTGGVVVHGGVGFEGLDTGHLKILQSTDKAIINWQDFSIQAGEVTEFIQPGRGSLALNRVVSGNPSAIFGTLKANGGVMLINTNGILVGAGGLVDVAGSLTLSTLDIDDADFLNGGDNRFRGNSSAGVTNLGTIMAGGDVVLLGNFIDNKGTIGAADGVVAMGAGGDIIVHQQGEAKISVLAGGPGGKTGINNSGTVDGAAVELKAHGNVYALAIQNSGMIRANGASFINGKLTLDAGPGGVITNTGTLRARNADGSGGTIDINAGPSGTVNLEGGEVDANGEGSRPGGVINVDGAFINIDNTSVTADGGDGGTVTIGSKNVTRSVNVGAGALISANGTAGDGGVINVQGRPN